MISNFSICLGNVLAKMTAEDSAETFEYYVGNSFDMPQQFVKGYDLFFFNSWDYLIYLNYIVFIYNTPERMKRKTLFLLLITLCWFVSLLWLENTSYTRKARSSKCSSVWKNKVSNTNWVVTENQSKPSFRKKEQKKNWDDTTSMFGLLTIRQHSATWKHITVSSRWQVSSEKAKKG